MSHDEGNKSETELSDTKDSETSIDSLDYKNLHDLTIIESDSPLLDSCSEKCVIDSDSDKSISLDSDLEQHSKDSDSIIWGMDLDTAKYPLDADSVKCLLEAEKYQMASGCVEDLMESEQHLVGAEQCLMDINSLKHWMDSDSEKCFTDSDFEKYVIDSDNKRHETDSDSEKCLMASAPVEHLLKAEKGQMVSDSIKLMESKNTLMESEQYWMFSASERYVIDSGLRSDKMDSTSVYEVHLMEEQKHQKTRSKKYMIYSDSESCGMDLERHELASAAVKCLMNAKTLNTDTEGRWMDSWPENHSMDLYSVSPGMVSDPMKYEMMTENCHKGSEREKFWMGLKSESERQQFDFDCGRCWNSSRRHQYRSEKSQGSSGRCQDNFQKKWDNFERYQVYSYSKNHQASTENERYKFESERHTMEREQCLIQFENERHQLDEGRERYQLESDSKEKHKIASDNEKQHLHSKHEAQRLGARRKDNRPQGFWRTVFLSPSLVQEKETEEQHCATN
ncbi:uncharacterized protein LOC119246644 [Talpa occidentalis]|uniref:uncharacterized protein LOC119246644 n=1 Tax=Talpa occidentalis TaxID=50954 RepID=UPI00188EEC33|nr:uncharacterized protein LOC119246644 [Talpa occidentalis]